MDAINVKDKEKLDIIWNRQHQFNSQIYNLDTLDIVKIDYAKKGHPTL